MGGSLPSLSVWSQRLLFGVFLLLLTPRCHAHSFTGLVERVIDGDTIVIGTNVVRLAEIDAPEMNMEYGSTAKAALEEMTLGNIVVVEWNHRGRYGRIIGAVFVGEVNVCHDLVVRGFARRYSRTSKTSLVAALEQSAREQGKGMWMAGR